jgi:hypothetical protein
MAPTTAHYSAKSSGRIYENQVFDHLGSSPQLAQAENLQPEYFMLRPDVEKAYG